MLSYFWFFLLLSPSNHKLSHLAAAESTSARRLLMPCWTHRDPPTPSVKITKAPVIGILSHPGDGAGGRYSNATNTSYIAASYVKFVECGGARVIPLIYNEKSEILNKKLSLVNGVIFTGGSSKKGHFFEVVQSIFKSVVRKNDAGNHFPLLAICLGFELLAMVVSKDKNILDTFDAREEVSTLSFVKKLNITGTPFERFPPHLLLKLTREKLVVLENHHMNFVYDSYIMLNYFGVSPEKFQKNKNLNSFFKMLTTSESRDKKVYVSTVQARKYPVTGFQWHPEKNSFEWGLPMIPHSEAAVQVTQNVANFFVREARRSSSKPCPSEVLENLIYKYKPKYCGRVGRGFDQVYVFA